MYHLSFPGQIILPYLPVKNIVYPSKENSVFPEGKIAHTRFDSTDALCDFSYDVTVQFVT